MPAEVRKRWKTRTVSVEDHGDSIVVRPAPEDPIEAVQALFAGRDGPSSDEMRREFREEEMEAEERKWGRG